MFSGFLVTNNPCFEKAQAETKDKTKKDNKVHDIIMDISTNVRLHA